MGIINIYGKIYMEIRQNIKRKEEFDKHWDKWGSEKIIHSKKMKLLNFSKKP